MSHPQGNPRALSPALAWLPRLSPTMWVVAIAVAAIAASLPGIWTLPALAAFLLSLLVLIKPEVAAYLLTFSVPFGSLAGVGGEEDSFSITPTEVLVALMAIGWLARSLARRRLQLAATPLTAPLAAMLAVVILSAYQATDVTLTLKESLKWLELVLVYLFVLAEMATARQVTLLVVLLLSAAILEALVGSVQFALGLGPEPFAIGRFMRAYGTFKQPNPYAGYLGMLIPLSVGLLLATSRPRLRWYALAACLLAASAVGMSLSRGAWVGISLAVLLMLLLWSRRSRILLVLLGIAATPLAFLAFLNLLPQEVILRLATVLDYFRFFDVTTEVVTSQNFAVVERVAHWQAALNMIADRPLLGVGAGNYPVVYLDYSLPDWDEPLGHAHNYYLNVTAETGFVGLLAYLSLLVAALAHTVLWVIRSASLAIPSPARETGDPLLWRGILVGVLGSLVASSVHNMFDNLFVHSMSVQLGMILALGQVAAGALSGRATPPGAAET